MWEECTKNALEYYMYMPFQSLIATDFAVMLVYFPHVKQPIRMLSTHCGAASNRCGHRLNQAEEPTDTNPPGLLAKELV